MGSVIYGDTANPGDFVRWFNMLKEEQSIAHILSECGDCLRNYMGDKELDKVILGDLNTIDVLQEERKAWKILPKINILDTIPTEHNVLEDLNLDLDLDMLHEEQNAWKILPNINILDTMPPEHNVQEDLDLDLDMLHEELKHNVLEDLDLDLDPHLDLDMLHEEQNAWKILPKNNILDTIPTEHNLLEDLDLDLLPCNNTSDNIPEPMDILNTLPEIESILTDSTEPSDLPNASSDGAKQADVQHGYVKTMCVSNMNPGNSSFDEIASDGLNLTKAIHDELQLSNKSQEEHSNDQMKCEPSDDARAEDQEILPSTQKLAKGRSHKCKVCEKTFAWRSILTRHECVRTGDKPFQCHICKKAFTRSSYLKKHIQLHSTEQPFKCHVCGKTFNSYSASHDN